VKDRPTLVGSRNALAGMKLHYAKLVDGADPLDVAIEVVKVQEADPEDNSVGLGGIPNEAGVVQLDAAVMHGPTHNSGAVACIEDTLHPSEVARLVMERSDHCMIVGTGAREFARMHGHPAVNLLTEASREAWLAWKETMSDQDDRLPPREKEKHGRVLTINGEAYAVADLFGERRPTGTIHCSALARNGDVACTTTTSGLSFKIPGRVGDSPIIGAGLYCDMEAGSAGATGRGEFAILANSSAMIVELLRQGASPLDAGMELLRRVERQARRANAWQPGMVDEAGIPAHNVTFYVLGLDGSAAGVQMTGKGSFAVADSDGGPRLEPTVALHP
jgi:N4-(beta-N-acetylglucosaminyl)-L-asparaginase